MKKRSAKKPPRIALVAAFADAPDAKALMAHYQVPAKLAKRGIYLVGAGLSDWLFKKHPETKLPAKVGNAGILLIAAIIDQDQARTTLGGECDVGFHADLDAKALGKAFEDEGFRLAPAPISKVAGIAFSPTDPWPAAAAFLKSGEVEIHELLSALQTHDDLTPPSDKVMSLFASKLERREDVRDLRRVLEAANADLIACALPLVARLWRPKKAKTKPRGLPPELTTLLSAFDGIPALGVMSASELAERHAYLLRLAQGATKVGKRDWGATPKEIRIDRFWRDGWIPFCTRPDDRTIAIDLDPAAKGTKGQIIGVHLNPPTLTRYRATLGEWLWNELDGAWR